jgi:hypothetical protein
VIEFREAAFDGGLSEVVTLMREVFPHAGKFTPDYVEWLYLKNPRGPLTGFHIYDDGKLRGQVAGILQDVMIKGEEATALLLLDVAIHPSLRGRGIFLEGVKRIVALARGRGIAAVIGVANQNTWRGYKKLGFQIVGALDARLVCVQPRAGENVQSWTGSAELFRRWTDDTLRWRMANPKNPLSVAASTDRLVTIAGRSPYPYIRALATIPRGELRVRPTITVGFGPSLVIGLSPPGTVSFGPNIKIPDRLKPSPLQLIYFNVLKPEDRLRRESVLFSFLDFDPF